LKGTAVIFTLITLALFGRIETTDHILVMYEPGAIYEVRVNGTLSATAAADVDGAGVISYTLPHCPLVYPGRCEVEVTKKDSTATGTPPTCTGWFPRED